MQKLLTQETEVMEKVIYTEVMNPIVFEASSRAIFLAFSPSGGFVAH